jgi:hypothetical protein
MVGMWDDIYKMRIVFMPSWKVMGLIYEKEKE